MTGLANSTAFGKVMENTPLSTKWRTGRRTSRTTKLGNSYNEITERKTKAIEQFCTLKLLNNKHEVSEPNEEGDFL